MSNLSDSTCNLSAVLLKKGQLVLKQMPLPTKPGSKEVILKSLSVGICGSDVHYWTHGGIGHFQMTGPMILGHETSAEVIEVGEKVFNLKVGDIVAVEPGTPCRCCTDCKIGNYNLCPDMTFHATPPFDGTLTRYFKHPADLCFKLPSNISPDEGAIIEPLSVGVYACKRAGINVGDNVLVCGAGPIGLVTLLAAKAFGARSVCITDMNEKRLEIAKQLGATCTVTIDTKEDAENTVKKVVAALGQMPDYTIDCAGFQSTITLGLLATKPGGAVIIAGMGQSSVTIPLIAATVREVDIKGIFRYKNTWPLCRQLLEEGKIDVKKLITHRFPLEKALDAFEVAKSGEGIKVIIDCVRTDV